MHFWNKETTIIRHNLDNIKKNKYRNLTFSPIEWKNTVQLIVHKYKNTWFFYQEPVEVHGLQNVKVQVVSDTPISVDSVLFISVN